MQLSKSLKNEAWQYTMIVLGLLIYTFAWSAFLIPSQILGGGVSGISAIVYYLSDQTIPVGILSLAINAVLFVFALRLLGGRFGINTVLGIVLSAAFFLLFQQGIGVQNYIDHTKFDPFMVSVIGGALSGFGIGLAFAYGGNTGGTDIVALVLNKYYNISPGKVTILVNLVVIGFSYFISYEVEKVVYGYIQLFVMSTVLDYVIDGNKQSYQILVFSKHADAIADAIGSEIKRGITLLDAHGWYTKENTKVILMIARKVDRQVIMNYIHSIDPQAFISVSKVMGVFGKNFDSLKLK